MERNFTTSDARSLISRHRQMLRSIEEICRISDVSSAQLSRLVETAAENGVFEQIIKEEIRDGSGRASYPPEAEQIIAKLAEIQKTRPVSAKCGELKKYADKINAAIGDAERAANGIRWAFSSSGKKTRAVEAYQYLTSLAEGSYGRTLEECEKKIREIANGDRTAGKADLEKNRSAYKEVFEASLSGTEAEGPPVPSVRSLVEKDDVLLQQFSGAKQSADHCRREVQEAVERFRAREALAFLKEMPVDNLAKSKLLKENGYRSVADVLAATTYQLTAINGIGEASAVSIKESAREISAGAGREIKIRLSADERTPEATEVVKAVCRFRQIEKTAETIEHVNESLLPAVSKDREALLSIGDGRRWIFLSDDEKRKLAGHFSEYIKALEGGYSEKIREVFEGMRRLPPFAAEKTAWDDFIRDPAAYAGILERLSPGALGNDDDVYGLPESIAREIQDEAFFPDGLLCTLRRYQEWGVKYILHQENVLLGDEMGLGKTIQAIAAMVSLKNTGGSHFMVICPASILSNWVREIRKMSLLRVFKAHGRSRMGAFEDWKQAGGVLVTTYETVQHFYLEDRFSLALMVVDEAHYIKNPNAQRTIHTKRIAEHAERKLFMTGTALENRVDEMIGLISILQPEVAARAERIAFMHTAAEFRELIAPVYYRRKREDVLTELPELIETEEWCTLKRAERLCYEAAVLSKNFMEIRRVSWNAGDDAGASSKACRLKELVESAQEEERKILVFSFFRNTLEKVKQMFGEQSYGPINGSVPPHRRQEILDAFEDAPPGSVLVAQIQSGGTGLNIQSASMVVLCEPQLKPSTENQAISRAYRMGQGRNVLVHRLLCEDTIDERIMDLLADKQEIFNAFADESKAAERSDEIDEKTFGELINEEIERINAERACRKPEEEEEEGLPEELTVAIEGKTEL